MACKRKEHMWKLGVNADLYCESCTLDMETNWCNGYAKLHKEIATLLEATMEGHPEIVEAS